MERVLRWGRIAFLICATTMMMVIRRVGESQNHAFQIGAAVVVVGSVVTLPLAVISVWRESDAKSKRNWLLLFGVCGLVLAAAFIWHT